VTARCAATGANVWSTGPMLRVPDLVRWADALDQLHRGRPEGVATLTSDEPNPTAVIRSTDRGQLQLAADLTPDPLTPAPRPRFPVERSVLPGLVRQGRAIVKAYPVRDPGGGRDSWRRIALMPRSPEQARPPMALRLAFTARPAPRR